MECMFRDNHHLVALFVHDKNILQRSIHSILLMALKQNRNGKKNVGNKLIHQTLFIANDNTSPSVFYPVKSIVARKWTGMIMLHTYPSKIIINADHLFHHPILYSHFINCTNSTNISSSHRITITAIKPTFE